MNILYEGNAELRQALDEITRTLPREKHPALIAGLRLAQRHGIEPAHAPEIADIPLTKFTCFMHAFDLIRSAPIIKIAQTFRDTYPGGDFVSYLVAHCLSEVSQEAARDGDLVVYSNGGRIVHAGKLNAGRVVSKWGTGYLWEHAIAEIPGSYGEEVRFYRAVSQAVAEEAFVAYSRKREGTRTIDLLLGR
jgi:hypothetical protein